jgi:hypothetical protein
VTIILLDRSISMSYGHGATKLGQCKDAIYEIHGELGTFGVLLFDHIVDEALPIGQHPDAYELRKAIDPIPTRGTTALSAALKRAVDLLRSLSEPKRIVLLTDGRLNFALDGSISECGPSLQAESLAEARRSAENGIKVDCLAAGEDGFISLLMQISEITGGVMSTPEGIAFDAQPRLAIEAVVHGMPEELPAGRPTWAKELDSEHIIVASDEAASIYVKGRVAVLANPISGRMMRSPIMSIEVDALKDFRARRSATSESVRKGTAILVDSANRKAIDAGPKDKAFLRIF